MKNNIIFKSVSLSLVLLTVLSLSFMPASAASTTQMKNEIERLEEESEKLEKEISKLKGEKAEQQKIKDKLTAQINNTQAEISACTKLINSFKSEIKECEAEIAKSEAEIEDTKFLFRQRMRSIYMSGSTNNDLLVLLDADSFSDYLALSEVSRTISAHDKKIVSEITDAIKTINESKKAINEKMTAQNEIKKSLAEKQSKLKRQQSEINGVIATISADQSELEKDNKEYEAAINKLEREIQEAIAAANKPSGSSGSKNPVFVSGKFLWPVPGYYNITSYYGQRWGRLHGGIDISSAGIGGKPIIAAADGVVLSAGYNTGGFGNWVMINHGTKGGNQYTTISAHMKYTPSVKTGQKVTAGQVIGYVGNTGRSYGNHLHFEVRVNGSRTNPMNYFNRAS
ncbi:MAG: peptidoglycan DD-metalloendopeptidase family protein [Clostridia bacterium]|nr:peptidoglycan DD-metalloendopeptidase family protein [Clostridia bacterium]